MLRYENVSHSVTLDINNKVRQLDRLKHMMTDRERQYTFLTYLQNLPLTKDQVFTVYTNTEV